MPEPRLATGLWFVPFCILVAGASFGAAYVVIQSGLSGSARFSLIHPLWSQFLLELFLFCPYQRLAIVPKHMQQICI